MSVVEDVSLTAEQIAIVEADLIGPYVVDAGAGTGKTFTLVRRATRLVEQRVLEPSQLLIVTFMNKAANEVGERLTVEFQKLGYAELPTVSTFHALAASLVREFAYACGTSPDIKTIDDFRARAIFNRAFDALLAHELGVDLATFPLLERGEVLPVSLVDLALSLKNRGVTVDEFESSALAAAEAMKVLPFGQLYCIGAKGQRTYPDPKPEFTADERFAQGVAEERNVRVVVALLRRFDELLAAEALMTYGDVLNTATRMLLAHPWIAERLRARWRHAMVDEFQDTNPQQMAFLEALFGSDLRPVMVVGDVRQAIFEWNGADPRGIQAVAKRPGARSFPLTLNRRSPQQALDLAHDVLPAQADYRGNPLVADAGHGAGVVVRHALYDTGANTAESRELEAGAIATEIAALVSSGIDPKEIVVLLRARTAARVYAKALSARGIPSKTHGGVGFFDAPEIRDAVAWLRLLNDPSDAYALTRVLESPVIGLSHGAMARLFHDTDLAASVALLNDLPAWLSEAERQRMTRLRAILGKLGPALATNAPDAIRAVIAETAIDVAHETDSPNAAPQIRANVAKLIALAAGFSRDRPLAQLADFLDELAERDALEIDESEAELGGDEVSIMTMHSAKGLEWDYVFIANVSPAVFPNSGGRSDNVVAYDERAGALAMRYDLDGQKPLRWTMRSTLHDALTGEKLAKLEKDEERRIFYVALTRAKKALWISGVGRTKPSDFMLEVRAFCEGKAFAAPFGDAAREYATDAAEEALERTDVRRILDRMARPPSLFDAPSPKLSYTAISTQALCPRLARNRYLLRIPDLRDGYYADRSDAEDDDDRRDKLDPALFGTMVHAGLETIAKARISNEKYDLENIVAEILEQFERADSNGLSERVASAVSVAARTLEPYEPIAAEAEFDTTIAGVRVGGFIDLIAKRADGVITIIDYKTGHVPDDSYALQLALYRVAVDATYPEADAVILRVSEDEADVRTPALPSRAVVEANVVAAASMNQDVPKPGIHCLSCPYAESLCTEGEAFNCGAPVTLARRGHLDDCLAQLRHDGIAPRIFRTGIIRICEICVVL